MVHAAIASGYRLRGSNGTSQDHDAIHSTYGTAFDTDPWPDDWDRFTEFDPEGVFVVEFADSIIGFSISFHRSGYGYVSVVAVEPDHQRKGVASALIAACGARFTQHGLGEIRIDAFEDSRAAVQCYLGLGFEIIERIEDPESSGPGA